MRGYTVADEVVAAQSGAPGAAALAAMHLLRSPAGAAVAARLAALAAVGAAWPDPGPQDAREDVMEGGREGGREGGSRRSCSPAAAAVFHLLASAAACPVAAEAFAPFLPQLAAAAVVQWETSAAARRLLAALRVTRAAPNDTSSSITGCGNVDGLMSTAPPSPHDVVSSLAPRYPRGRRKFRVALARSALHAAETEAAAVARGLPLTAAAAAAVAAALRLFIAAVTPAGDSSCPGGGGGGKHSRASATVPLGTDMMRCAKLFTAVASDGRGAPAAAAAADSCAVLADRFLASASGGGAGGGGGGGGGGGMGAGGVVTPVAVAVSLAAMSLPSPECVAAGLRLAAGLSE